MDRVVERLRDLVDGSPTAAQIQITRNGETLLDESFGRVVWDEKDQVVADGVDRPVTDESPFLIASITKPVTATAVLRCAERGLIDVGDPVSESVPDFTGAGSGDVRVRDLLRHTSGLPDMLPENESLRRRNALPEEFVRRVIDTAPDFEPGSAFRYQSMGVNLAGEIVERVTDTPLREFVDREIIAPLGMDHTFLGMGGRPLTDLVPCDVDPKPGDEGCERWDWNSRYWRDFGAPWGGLHSTASDLTVFLRTFLDGGKYEGGRLLEERTVTEMTTNQIDRPDATWGLGWGFRDSPAWTYFGTRVSASTLGHSGATGTLAWADPERDVTFVCLTTRPMRDHEDGFFESLSDSAIAAIEE
jgi:CubicO group peptidase (beta-lactamase class C family)